MRPRHLAAIVALTLCWQACAQNWPRFRGENGAGVAPGTLPAELTAKDQLWKAQLPGGGHSSPVIWGDRVFVTAADRQTARRMVLCYGLADGAQQWQRQFDSQTFRQHADNSYASATPAADAQRVYVCWTTPRELTLLALDHAGRDAWRVDLGPYGSQHGAGTSPILFDDLVILANDQEAHDSFIFAVEAATGKIRWKLPRRSTSASAATPCIYRPKDGPPQLIHNSRTEGMVGVDAREGKVLWSLPAVFERRVVSSPVVAGDLVLGTCGEGGAGRVVVAVRPGDAARKAEVAWTVTAQCPYVPTPLPVGDRIYLWSDSGTVTCLRAADGQKLWQEKVGGNSYTSPICVGDRLLGITRQGEAAVLSLGETPQVAGRWKLGETCFSTPAVSGGRMVLRTYTALLCVATGK